MKERFNVVGFLARARGLSGLRALTESDKYNPIMIITHRDNPKSEDPDRSERDDFKDYQEITSKNGIVLCSADFVYPNDNHFKGSNFDEFNEIYRVLSKIDNIDFITSISWRNKLPIYLLKKPKYGSVNLHRGKLPDYAGGYPVERALKDGEREIQICSHIIEEEYDTGEVIERYKHPVNYDNTKSLPENVKRLIIELTPHFGTLLIKSLDALILKDESKK